MSGPQATRAGGPRIAILGNSGSGKSTLARRLARERGVTDVLELDLVYWEPGRIAVERPAAERIRALETWCSERAAWIIEGCYADLVEASLRWRPELILLHPGPDVCRRHALARPHEPHKYRDKADQDRMLATLLAWVDAYYTRDDAMSLSGHRRVFDAYDGPKREITDLGDV